MIETPLVPVSWGELLDKITILEIKAERIVSETSRANVLKELRLLSRTAGEVLARSNLRQPLDDLRAVNRDLWDIEDGIRAEEARGRFGPDFVRLARAVYMRNDERAAIKRRINALLGSELVEEKSYWSGANAPFMLSGEPA
ncbi:hypothetical protein HJG53_11605 [Sphingomonas sp. ID1715]|uniref:DUF6165 family protein n=1 Tax=Sphingomonas sp. ID1715 TaxID=1656898 RepID=UPI0014897034|nr:DUF6165 family protein [Sphingomonas sp. ID1715]NNM77554.1 hypothetical protein [Sphingomonas sp. ID1715]